MTTDCGRVGKAETGSREPGLATRPGPSGFDPARSEQSLRDKINFLLGARGKPTKFAKLYRISDESVLAFMRGVRPPEPKLLEALGYRREYRYSPCPCFTCTARRTDLDPGPMQFGCSVEMQRMFLCEHCGNKRCPHATNHVHECTGSNEPGQSGSAYEFPANAAIAIEARQRTDPEEGLDPKGESAGLKEASPETSREGES